MLGGFGIGVAACAGDASDSSDTTKQAMKRKESDILENPRRACGKGSDSSGTGLRAGRESVRREPRIGDAQRAEAIYQLVEVACARDWSQANTEQAGIFAIRR